MTGELHLNSGEWWPINIYTKGVWFGCLYVTVITDKGLSIMVPLDSVNYIIEPEDGPESS